MFSTLFSTLFRPAPPLFLLPASLSLLPFLDRSQPPPKLFDQLSKLARKSLYTLENTFRIFGFIIVQTVLLLAAFSAANVVSFVYVGLITGLSAFSLKAWRACTLQQHNARFTTAGVAVYTVCAVITLVEYALALGGPPEFSHKEEDDG